MTDDDRYDQFVEDAADAGYTRAQARLLSRFSIPWRPTLGDPPDPRVDDSGAGDRHRDPPAPGAGGFAAMQVGDRVRRLGLDGPEGPIGYVVRVLGGNARGMVRVRWHDTRGSVRLHAAAALVVVAG